MKNINKTTKFSVGLLLSVLMLSGLFTFTIPDAKASDCDSRIITGTVDTGTPPARARFTYGTSQSNVANGGGTPTTVRTYNSEGYFPIEELISGLSQNTTYYYRLEVTNNYGTANGDVRSFTTPQCQQEPQTCQDRNATNYGGSLPCRYAPTTCQDPNATNYGGSLPCRYAPTTCQDPSATNYGGALPCRYAPTTCQDPSATNYGGALPCRYAPTTCQDHKATNYGGPLPCQYKPATCQDPSARNYGGPLPCEYKSVQPTVNITADRTNIERNDSTYVRWTSQNATSCTGSGGTNGWSGSKPISGSFNTGSLTSDKTYTITCSNNSGSANDSVTVRVEEDEDEDDVSVNLRADETSIDSGDSTILRWTSQNADSCRGTGGRNGWSGSKPRSGSFNTGSLEDTTTYKIICEDNNSSAEDDDSVTVRVSNQTCQDVNATNYRGSAPCRYQTQTCQDVNATNFGGSIPCRYAPVNNQPTVNITADSTNLAFNGSTTIRWSTTNATSCNASGGSTGWAGPKSIGPGSFFTGSLTGTRTYSITCVNNVGSATDSVTVNVRGQVLGVTTTPSAYLVVNSSVDRNRPIVPTLDNTNPCPGDEINYTLTYQNIGTGSVRNLVLRVDLPLEVTYLSSNPSNPTVSGNTLIFNLGTLGANRSGTVSIRVLVRDNVAPGTNLNFPATLNYVDPSGLSQSVSANVSANVCGTVAALTTDEGVSLSASVFGAGFLPTSIFGWLLLLILILILVLLAKYLFGQSFQKKTVTTFDAPLGRKTTTTVQQ